MLEHGGERKDGLAEFMGKHGLYFLQHEAWNDDKTHIIGENATSGRPLTHRGHRAVAYTARPCPLGPEQALQRPDPTATAQERPHHGSLVCSAGKARGEARENATPGRPGTHRGHRAVARTLRPRP